MAIGPIMVELMEKRSIESGNAGLEDTEPWSKEIREFLLLTNSPSLKQLKTVIAQTIVAPHIADFYSMLSLNVHLRKKNLYCWLILHTLLHTNCIATKDDDASKFAYISLLRFSKTFRK